MYFGYVTGWIWPDLIQNFNVVIGQAPYMSFTLCKIVVYQMARMTTQYCLQWCNVFK